MKFATLAAIISTPLALASCVSSDNYEARYGEHGGAPVAASSFSYTGGMPAAAPQRSGWTTSPGIREAERKSVARDIPYGVVNPKGTVVYK